MRFFPSSLLDYATANLISILGHNTIGNVTLAKTEKTIKPEIKIIKALIKNHELGQYQMPKETKLSYRTILRTLKPLENEGLITQIRTEPSTKGGKEKKIYSLTFKGILTYLNSITPKPNDYLVKDNFFHYSPNKANEIITKKIQPLKLYRLEIFLENCGKQQELPIFKQVNWLREHYGLNVFRAIVLAASSTMERNKLPNLNLVKKNTIESGNKDENIELTLEDFRRLEDDFLREAFEKEFSHQLASLKGTGDLHNDILEKLFAKLAARIERENQRALSPLKDLVQTLK
jgi:DNA-binding PadR family transcriptional regulator